MNRYYQDFISIKEALNTPYEDVEIAKKTIKPVFLKLNNPTFYKKYIYSHPAEQHGFPTKDFTDNFLVKFTNDCIKILNESQDLSTMLKLLQVEYSWANNQNITYWLKNA